MVGNGQFWQGWNRQQESIDTGMLLLGKPAKHKIVETIIRNFDRSPLKCAQLTIKYAQYFSDSEYQRMLDRIFPYVFGMKRW